MVALLSMKGTSHLKRYSTYRPHRITLPNGQKKPLYAIHLKGVQKCNSFGGLTVMNNFFQRDSLQKLSEDNPEDLEYMESKKKQLNTFTNLVKFGKEKATLFVLLSNDYKSFLSRNNRMLSLNRTARKKWDKLSNLEKANYEVSVYKPLTRDDRKHIEEQFAIYSSFLKNLLKNTELEIFYHSSVLERINPKVKYLPLYFAIMNSILKHNMKVWSLNETFKNKFGNPIKCQFVCVRQQFFVPSPESLFCESELSKFKRNQNIELTHRNEKSLDKLVSIWTKALTNSKFKT